NSNLTVTSDITNDGLIKLQAGGAGATSAGLAVTTGTLTNTGTIQSVGDAGSPANRLAATITNRGTVDAVYALQLSNAGKTFDTAAGTVNVAAGQVLAIDQGTTLAGSDTDFGTGTGTIALRNGTLNLASDTTLAAGGPTLELTTET